MDYDHFMSRALELAEQALDAGEFPVGCVIACGEEIVATGYRASIIAAREAKRMSDAISDSIMSEDNSLPPPPSQPLV